MAAATASPLIEPTKAAKYTITVSDKLLNGSVGKKRKHASIQCMICNFHSQPYSNSKIVNHKPKLPKTSLAAKISKASAPNTYKLSMNQKESNGGDYKYTGSQSASNACILFYDPATSRMTLDQLDTHFDFNLQSMPTNSDSQELGKRYPHIGTEQPGHEASVGEDAAIDEVEKDEDVADPNNPYDYRHFLQEANRRRTPSPETRTYPGSSPAQRPSAVSSPAVRPSRPATKPKPRPKPQQKRRASPPPREEADADNEDSDGDLIIEMEPGTKRKNRFMGAFDRDITSNGPVSLRSAASSMSPAMRARRDDSLESQNRDADVEELRLPSPRRSSHAMTPQEESELEADLEAELELALEASEVEDHAGGVGLGIHEGTNGVAHAESSSESEEE